MTHKLKKVLITVVALAALALGGSALAGAASSGDSETGDKSEAITGDAKASAEKAALAETGGGKVNQSELDNENGATYEVEVAKTDGTEVDVRLDDKFNVVTVESDSERSRASDRELRLQLAVSLICLSSAGGDDGCMRVLVVDDDVRMAGAIRRGLRYDGLVVDVAADGEEALRVVATTEYDVIVLDVLMPGLGGFETCRRLRADGRWTPVLMLTARDAVEDRVRGLDGGADDYLTKPFSLAELTARLRALRAPRPGRAAGRDRGRLAAPRPCHARGPARRGGDQAERQGVRAAGDLHAPAGPGPEPHAAAGGGLGPRLRAALEHHRGLRPLPAREDQPAVRGPLDRDRARAGYRLRRDGGT